MTISARTAPNSESSLNIGIRRIFPDTDGPICSSRSRSSSNNVSIWSQTKLIGTINRDFFSTAQSHFTSSIVSGLSALHYCKKLAPELSVKLFEREDRLGGTIGTENVNGYSFDIGPNGFLDREPLTLEFVAETNITAKFKR